MEIICYVKNDVQPKAPTKTEYIYENKITKKKKKINSSKDFPKPVWERRKVWRGVSKSHLLKNAYITETTKGNHINLIWHCRGEMPL